tara:strand:+ start:1195 stop:1449 length:255 start_codon:yes stop_codon:yes gene_type:complete
MGGRISKPINKDKYTIDDTEQLSKTLDTMKNPEGAAMMLMMQNRNPEAKGLGARKFMSMVKKKRGLLNDSTATMSSNNKKTTLG